MKNRHNFVIHKTFNKDELNEDFPLSVEMESLQ